MNTEELIEILERHLKQVENQASELYKIRLRKTIENLKAGEYSDEALILDLQSLGFQDIAMQIRRGQWA